MPLYQWDEDKRILNLRKHRLDFRRASLVYEHPNKITVDDPFPDEERFRDYAAVNGEVRVLIYTMRGSTVRCISFRAAQPHEERWYYEEITNR